MIGQFTVGQAIAAGGVNWRGILRMPLIFAVALGFIASVWRVPLPFWFTNTVSLIGDMTIPLMLLMLGASLARLQVETMSRAVLLSALRIGMGAGIGVAVGWLMGLDGTARAVLVMQCAMPVAVYNYLFAQHWNISRRKSPDWWWFSTFASVFSVPVLLHFLMH